MTIQENAPKHNGSASKTDLLLVCQYWASPDVKLPPDPNDPERTRDPKLLSDAPRFGVAFHLAMERHVRGGFYERGTRIADKVITQIASDHVVDDRRLLDYYRRAREFLRDFLKERNWTGIALIAERKLAYDPFRDKARFLESETTRDYSGRKATELPGTLDLASEVVEGRLFFTADWKTGVSAYEAYENKQLDSLSLGLSRVWDSHEAKSVNAIFRIDDEFIEPSVTTVGPKRWEKHRKKLRLALVEAYSKTPAMRAGIHCRYCPANEVCPAIVGPTAVDDMLSDATDSETVRRVYEMSAPLEKALENRRKRVMNWVESNGPIELSNGKELRILEMQQDNLSKASIERALGKVAGQDLIADLRSRGCIEKIDKKQMREAIVK